MRTAAVYATFLDPRIPRETDRANQTGNVVSWTPSGRRKKQFSRWKISVVLSPHAGCIASHPTLDPCCARLILNQLDGRDWWP